MNPKDLAEARTHAYGLLSLLLGKGLDAGRLAQVAQVPPLAEALGGEPDLDEVAAAHHSTFGFEVFPYAGVYLDASALTGGASANDMLEAYAAGGFTPDLGDTNADHVAIALAFLSFLSGAEAEALEDGEAEAVTTVRGLAAGFLDRNLLTWLPPFVVAVQGLERTFWTDVAEMALELAVAHRRELEGAEVDFALPAAPAILDDEDTSMRDIAAFLCTTRHVGAFLSRGEIGKVARAHDLPRGFGSREQTVQNLFATAAELGQAPALITALDDLMGAVDDRFASLEAGTGLIAHIAPWRARLSATRGMLEAMAERAAVVLAEAKAAEAEAASLEPGA